jgi:hypothetical protein
MGTLKQIGTFQSSDLETHILLTNSCKSKTFLDPL